MAAIEWNDVDILPELTKKHWEERFEKAENAMNLEDVSGALLAGCCHASVKQKLLDNPLEWAKNLHSLRFSPVKIPGYLMTEIFGDEIMGQVGNNRAKLILI